MGDKGRLSYACCPSTTPFLYQTVVDRLHLLAAENPDREAFVFYNNDRKRESLTRKQLLNKAEKAAKNLVRTGVQKGTTVAFYMSNSLKMVVMNFAVVMAGGIPFFMSGNLADGSELVEFINDMNGYLLIIDANKGDRNWKILEKIWPFFDVSSTRMPSLKMVLCNGIHVQENEHRKTLSTFMDNEDNIDIELPTHQPEDILLYFCTSGSTGKPKEVIYNHFSLLNCTKQTDDRSGITGKDVFFCDRSFGWIVGYPRVYLVEGTCRVFVDTRISIAGFHTDFLCDIIQKEKCDVIYMPGYLAVDVLKSPELSVKFEGVRTIILSGERILAPIYTGLKHFCKNVLVWYGTTEIGGASVFNQAQTNFEDGVIGKPLSGVEMKVIDEDGNLLPTETQGVLCVRNNWRFSGYRNNEEVFRQTVNNDNWVHTEDMARMREDGNFVVDGRLKEIISTGTSKYFPWMIEKVLKKIEGAEYTIAIAVPDPRLYQVICACVVPKSKAKLTETDVKKFCDESFLESSTMGVGLKPRYYLVLNDLPLTPSGKIDRKTLTLIAKEKLGM